VLNTVMGLSILIVAVGLYLGFGWSRWPGIIGAALVGLHGNAWAGWTLGQGFEPVGVIYGLFEPLLAVFVIERLVRRWPADVAWNQRLR